jgi:AraC-like DNA-binding protein
MKDQAVGHKMVVPDRLALLVTTVFSDDSFAAEESPWQKAVRSLYRKNKLTKSEIARNLGISRTSVRRLFKANR